MTQMYIRTQVRRSDKHFSASNFGWNSTLAARMEDCAFCGKKILMTHFARLEK